MVKWVTIYGIAAVVSSGLAIILATAKGRDYNFWGFACFVFPPSLLVLLLTPSSKLPRPRPPSWDEQDRYGRD